MAHRQFDSSLSCKLSDLKKGDTCITPALGSEILRVKEQTGKTTVLTFAYAQGEKIELDSNTPAKRYGHIQIKAK